MIPHIARVSLLTALTGSRTGLAVIEVASLCAAAHGAHEHASRAATNRLLRWFAVTARFCFFEFARTPVEIFRQLQ